MDRPPKYVVITPVRDEEKYIKKTISSLLSQTIKPVEWVIVNDGSSDNTGKIIDGYAAVHHWIKALHRGNRGFRRAGGGVIDTFYDGFNSIETSAWDFVVKLDGDLEFFEDYFERCFEYFEKDPKLGISGGGIYHVVNEKIELEENPIFHVRGATKIYRRACWYDINGLFRGPGWDTIDEIKAHMFGWETKGLNHLKVVHLRYTGEAEGKWRDWVKNGLANYITGYHPLFVLFKCLKRSFQKPYGIVPVGLLYGFLSGYIKKIPQVDDKDLIRYIRKQQINRLLLKPSIWGRGYAKEKAESNK
jgi:poly-beta-1,6-N-acetyl-D-glucosamine synthase